jgi:hypothetical protein
LKKRWLCTTNSSSAWHTGQSGGAPDSVRCPRLVNGELAALGKRRSCTAIIHRTVRWCIGLSGESSATNSSLSGKEKGDVAIIHQTVRWCTDCPVSQRRQCQRPSARSTRDAPTVGWVHQTVRCAPDNVQCATSPEEQWSDAPDMEGDCAPDKLQWLSDGTPHCPVRHSIEGKDSLPC